MARLRGQSGWPQRALAELLQLTRSETGAASSRGTRRISGVVLHRSDRRGGICPGPQGATGEKGSAAGAAATPNALVWFRDCRGRVRFGGGICFRVSGVSQAASPRGTEIEFCFERFARIAGAGGVDPFDG